MYCKYLSIRALVSYVKRYSTTTREERFSRIFFTLHEELIESFHSKFYIHAVEKLSFHIAHVRIIGSLECGNTR